MKINSNSKNSNSMSMMLFLSILIEDGECSAIAQRASQRSEQRR
jgi:hypothetical protein